MEINLNEKTFVFEKVKGRAVRNGIALQRKIDADGTITPENLDEGVDFVCFVYGDRFTRDEVYDEIDSDDLMNKILETLNRIIGGPTEKAERFPSEQ